MIFTTDLPFAILVDIDGTLALRGERGPYDHAQCELDAVNEPIADLLDAYHESRPATRIILVTGRGVQYKPQTALWLAQHGIPYSHLFMRAQGDSRKDAIVKREIYEQHIAGKYNVRFVLDDRNHVVRLWREELGLTCLQVAEGDF